MVKLSFFVLLTLLVALCAAENGELGVKNEGYPKNDVETTWKKFMVRNKKPQIKIFSKTANIYRRIKI